MGSEMCIRDSYDSVLCLNKMAEVLGYSDDATHWNASIDMEHVMQHLEYFWEIDTPGMFGGTGGGIGWTQIASSGDKYVPPGVGGNDGS